MGKGKKEGDGAVASGKAAASGGAASSGCAEASVVAVVCAHCGKKPSQPKQCSVCKKVCYCGAECQKAAWKKHKKSCRQELDLMQVWAKVEHACNVSRDYSEVVSWDCKMEALITNARDDESRMSILTAFTWAHLKTQNYAKAAKGFERQVDFLGAFKLFRDQGSAMCQAGDMLKIGGDLVGARKWAARALRLAREHGFFETECKPQAPNPSP